MDVLQVVVLLFVELAEQALQQHLGKADDRVERRAQLVRHVGQELGLVLVGGLELPALVLDFAEQARVLDRDHRLVGEGPEQRDVLVGEGSDMVAADEDGADAPAFPEHRGEDDGANPRRARSRGARRTAHCCRSATSGKCRTVRRRIAAPVPVSASTTTAVDDLLQLVLPRTVIGRHANQTVLVDEIDADHRAGEQSLAARQDLVEHRRRVGDRAADRRKHLARGPLLFERLLRLVEQAHVLEGDRRLVAEGSQQRDFPVAERPHVLPAQQNRPERLSFAKERRDDHGAMAEALRDLVTQRVLGAGRQEVGHLDRLRSSTARPDSDSRLIGSASTLRTGSGVGPFDASSRSMSPSVRYIDATEASHSLAARSAIASSTGCTSVGELEMTRRISLIAVCCVERLLGLVEQAHVVDGDRRLPGKGLQQRHLVGRELPRLAAPDQQSAVRASFAHQRDREDSPEAEALLVGARARVVGIEQRNDVGVMERLAVDARRGR